MPSHKSNHLTKQCEAWICLKFVISNGFWFKFNCQLSTDWAIDKCSQSGHRIPSLNWPDLVKHHLHKLNCKYGFKKWIKQSSSYNYLSIITDNILMNNEQVCHLILKSSPTTPATPLALFSPNVEVTSLREAGVETLVISPLNMSLVTNLTSGMR